MNDLLSAGPPRRIAIVQSNYIPWKGYFDLINSVDEFILFDDAQYTKRDWRNRNLIKTPAGLKWLTIPVEVKGRYLQAIKETRILPASDWGKRHWSTLQACYAQAAHFMDFREAFEELYRNASQTYLSEVNRTFLALVCRLLGITTKISASMDYAIGGDNPSERLAGLCEQARATQYLSGPAAKAYMDHEPFTRRGIAVEYFNYSGYPEYRQMHPPFEHGVSILDLLFNEGMAAPQFMKTLRRL